MSTAAHLPTPRLRSEELTEEELAHLSACRPCRSEARWQRASTTQVGRYAVVGLLGFGGLARVHAAIDPDTGQRVALKRLLLPDPHSHARLRRELELQGQVRHEHVLPLLEVLELPEGPALVLPWVQGPDLATLLAQEPLPIPQKLALFRQILRGVDALHRQGLVHRDLKPANVLLDASGEEVVAKVADFGLVKGVDSSGPTQTGAALGTPAYMAPEQRTDAARVGAGADVWALGIILVELLTGNRPTGPHPGSSPWDELARQMLVPEPQGRPADAGEILARLPPTEPLPASLLQRCRELAPEPTDEQVVLPTISENLPAERDAFVGRHEELSVLAEKVLAARLVTVLGPGGIGKTRLCLRYASLWLESWPGGVWFCDLSQARDLQGVVSAVASALGVPLGVADPVLQLGHALAGRGRCLLLLDNFEQVAACADQTLGRWMARAEQVHFVVTSRQALELPGESLFELEVLRPDDGVALFLRRVQTTRPGDRLDSTEQKAIPALVALLDGLPLAIELAAARVTVMPPTRMLARMGERFRLLAAPGGRRDRHATLKAALDWSWELLSLEEQRALCQLSVFRGGFDEEAAKAVLGSEPRELVRSLVRKSLVHKSESGRFSLLMSVQEYADSKLGAEDRAGAEDRHGQYFAALSTEPQQGLAPELPNLRAACQRAIAQQVTERAVCVLEVAWGVLQERGPFGLATELAAAVAALPLSPALQARVDLVWGWSLWVSGHPGSIDHLERALAQARALGDSHLEGRVLVTLSGAHDARGGSQPLLIDQALQIFRALGDRLHEGRVQTVLGIMHHRHSRHAEAEACYRAALQLAREGGHLRLEADMLGNLGLLFHDRGQVEEATSHQQQALLLVRELGQRSTEVRVLCRLGNLHRVGGRTEEALSCLQEALVLARELGDRQEEGAALANLGHLHFDRGRYDEAQPFLEGALAIAREIGNARSEALMLGNLGAVHLQQGRLDEALACSALALQLHQRVGNRRQEGVLLGNLGNLYGQTGQPQQARAHYEAALAVHREVGNPRSEGVVLTNLGALSAEEGRLEEALSYQQQALALAQRTGDRRLEGATLGRLGGLYAQQGNLSEARSLFDAGVALLRSIAEIHRLAMLLLQRAQVEHSAGEQEIARAILAEAEQLVQSTGSGPDSELGRTLAGVRALL